MQVPPPSRALRRPPFPGNLGPCQAAARARPLVAESVPRGAPLPRRLPVTPPFRPSTSCEARAPRVPNVPGDETSVFGTEPGELAHTSPSSPRRVAPQPRGRGPVGVPGCSPPARSFPWSRASMGAFPSAGIAVPFAPGPTNPRRRNFASRAPWREGAPAKSPAFPLRLP